MQPVSRRFAGPTARGRPRIRFCLSLAGRGGCGLSLCMLVRAAGSLSAGACGPGVALALVCVGLEICTFNMYV